MERGIDYIRFSWSVRMENVEKYVGLEVTGVFGGTF